MDAAATGQAFGTVERADGFEAVVSTVDADQLEAGREAGDLLDAQWRVLRAHHDGPVDLVLVAVKPGRSGAVGSALVAALLQGL